MPNLIKKSIIINTSPKHVWRVFTDPAITKKMGGYYVSDWKEGHSLQWKGDDGKLYTYGILLEIVPGRLLKHSLYDLKTKTKVTSIITYTLEEIDDQTILHAEELLSYDMREEQFDEALEGWDMALASVKDTAERMNR